MIPVYLSRIKDAEKANQKLLREQKESAANIERLRNRLDKAERLICSMGTPESVNMKGTFRDQGRNEKGSDHTSSTEDGEDEDSGEDEDDSDDDQSSSSSEDESNGAGARESFDQNIDVSIDLSVSPTEPAVRGLV